MFFCKSLSPVLTQVEYRIYSELSLWYNHPYNHPLGYWRGERGISGWLVALVGGWYKGVLMPSLMDLIELRKYIPEIIEAIGHSQVLMDKDSRLEDRGEALVSLLDLAAGYTETEWDDNLVDKLERLTQQDDFWRALDMIIDCFMDDNPAPMTVMAAADEKGINTATVLLVVEVVIQIMKFFKQRK